MQDFNTCISMREETIAQNLFHIFVFEVYFCKQIIFLRNMQRMIFLIHRRQYCIRNNLSITNNNITTVRNTNTPYSTFFLYTTK